MQRLNYRLGIIGLGIFVVIVVCDAQIDPDKLKFAIKGIRREGKSLCDVGGENKVTDDLCPDTPVRRSTYIRMWY